MPTPSGSVTRRARMADQPLVCDDCSKVWYECMCPMHVIDEAYADGREGGEG